jgi:hypothetical protein
VKCGVGKIRFFFRIPVKMPPSWGCTNRGNIAGEVGRNIRWVRSEPPGGERGELWGSLHVG